MNKPTPQLYKLWLLRLVPDLPFARWWMAALIFGVFFGIYWWSGALTPYSQGGTSWAPALFFCVTFAYIIPVMNFITAHTKSAFDDLLANIAVEPEYAARLREQISSKSLPWLILNTSAGIVMWLVQSAALQGTFGTLPEFAMQSREGIAMTFGSLGVWVIITCAIQSLINNAWLFRRLNQYISVDLFDPGRQTPFGRMAVSSTLVVVGAQAAFPIMWLGDITDPWTTIPGMVIMTMALIVLFFAPLWPVHRSLGEAKRAELAKVQAQINLLQQGGLVDGSQQGDRTALLDMLQYRREIASVSQWPFDLGVVARLGLYLVIVPLTWIGAALIENVVDLVVD